MVGLMDEWLLPLSGKSPRLQGFCQHLKKTILRLKLWLLLQAHQQAARCFTKGRGVCSHWPSAGGCRGSCAGAKHDTFCSIGAWMHSLNAQLSASHEPWLPARLSLPKDTLCMSEEQATQKPHAEGRRPLAGSRTPPPPAIAAVCLQVQDSAMLTRIQGMVGVGSPLSAAVTQLKDRITSAATR